MPSTRASFGGLLAILLSLCGVVLCVYLTLIHLALLRGELLGGLTCGGSGGLLNCHAVTHSAYGRPLGVPLALWGLWGYLGALVLGFIAWQVPEWAGPALRALLGLSVVFVLVDAVLLWVMLTQIRFLCAVCLLTYLVNASLVVVTKWAVAMPWFGVARTLPATLARWWPGQREPVTWVVWGVVGTAMAAGLGLHAATLYVAQGPPGTLRRQAEQLIRQQPRVTVDVTGDPVWGPPSARLQVVEFSDFLCPYCQRAARYNPIVLASHRDEAALIFKHYPLDQSCNRVVRRTVHPTACQLAAASECAQEQGKFWVFHDRVFRTGPSYRVEWLERDLAELGVDLGAFRTCMAAGRGLEAVKRDVEEAARVGVTSTPTYVINGVRASGMPTPRVFDEVLRALRSEPRPPAAP